MPTGFYFFLIIARPRVIRSRAERFNFGKGSDEDEVQTTRKDEPKVSLHRTTKTPACTGVFVFIYRKSRQ
jgi:hypothetical protein